MTAALPGAPAFGNTIISQTFINTGSTDFANGLLAVSWTQIGSYTALNIFANLADESGNDTATGTGYLLDQIGPGTTLAGNEVPGVAPIAVSVTGNPGLNGMTKVYSNLTLGPEHSFW